MAESAGRGTQHAWKIRHKYRLCGRRQHTLSASTFPCLSFRRTAGAASLNTLLRIGDWGMCSGSFGEEGTPVYKTISHLLATASMRLVNRCPLSFSGPNPCKPSAVSPSGFPVGFHFLVLFCRVCLLLACFMSSGMYGAPNQDTGYLLVWKKYNQSAAKSAKSAKLACLATGVPEAERCILYTKNRNLKNLPSGPG